MDPAYVTAPVDAHLSDYIKGEGYSVIPEIRKYESFSHLQFILKYK